MSLLVRRGRRCWSVEDTRVLWEWLGDHHRDHQGGWVRLARVGSGLRSVSFDDLLEAGIAFGWSESGRRAHDERSYLQRFTPRQRPGTTSARNRAIAGRLEAEGRMQPAGRKALGAVVDEGSGGDGSSGR